MLVVPQRITLHILELGLAGGTHEAFFVPVLLQSCKHLSHNLLVTTTAVSFMDFKVIRLTAWSHFTIIVSDLEVLVPWEGHRTCEADKVFGVVALP